MKYLESAENHITATEVEDGKLFIKTKFFDDDAIARNKRIRDSGILEKAKLELHHNEDIRGAISCPSVGQWNQFNKDHPEMQSLLNSSHEHERMAALRLVSLHKPNWVLMTRN